MAAVASTEMRLARRIARVLREFYEDEAFQVVGYEPFIHIDFDKGEFEIELRTPDPSELGIQVKGLVVNGTN